MFFRVTSDTSLMRSVLTAIILILTVLSPTVSIAESGTEFKSTYFDRNSNGLDDRMEELINNTEARIVIQDPRTSTPGLGLLTWMKSIYGDNAGDKWKKLNKKIVTVTKGWTDAYYNIFLAGELLVKFLIF